MKLVSGIDRRGTNCEKWDVYRRGPGRDTLLPMWVADMDFASPVEIQEAIIRRAQHCVYGYTAIDDALYDAVIQWQKQRHDLDIAREEIFFLPGVVTLLQLAVRMMTQPGDGVLILTPIYGPFFSAIEKNDRRVVGVPLVNTAGGWRMDFTAIEQALATGIKLLLFCNPHNPVARVWTRDELAQLLAICERYDVTVVSDEIHGDFIMPGHEHVPFLSLPGAKKRVMMGTSATKTFNIAGLSHATAVIPNATLRSAIIKEGECCGALALNLFGCVATQAAYEHGAPWIDELVGIIAQNARLVHEFVAQPGCPIKASALEGTYLIWLDCTALGLGNDELNHWLQQKAGLGLSRGTDFGVIGEGFMRLNVGCPTQTLQRALSQLAVALQEWI